MQIVLIHIGEQLPPYFYDCAEQCRRFFPGQIHVIVPRKHVTDNAHKRIGLHPVACEDLMTSALYKLFEERCYLKGFWNVTFGRLLLLELLIKQKGLKDIIHVENDVLIFRDPNNHLDEFKKYSKGAVLINPVGDRHASAAYCYVPTAESISRLNRTLLVLMSRGKEWLETKMGPDINEMILLAYVWRVYNNMVKYLPIVPEGRGGAGISLFKSVFDSATIGQAVDGIPSKPGTPFYDIINHWVAPAFKSGKYNVEFGMSGGLKVPYLVYDKKRYCVNNIHVHSKRLKDFM